MTTTNIEWTDKTWNPVTGCTKVSPGCAHCYAEGVADRFWEKQYPPALLDGTNINKISTSHHEEYLANGLARPRRFTDVWTHHDRLKQPLRWKKPSRIFVNSMSDLFHEDVPEQFIHDVYHMMEQQAHWHTYQILTKRPDRMRAYLEWRYGGGRIPAFHIWHGVSVENRNYLHRIDTLKDTRSHVRFVSFEPLLEDVGAVILDRIHWCIVGGESGPHARPCEPAWIRSLVRQCTAANVPVFVKQLGAHVITRNDDGWEGDTPKSWPMDTRYDEELSGYRDGYQGAPVRVRLHSLKGGAITEWPEDLRVREYPYND